jgi:NADPH2:quinone reductase
MYQDLTLRLVIVYAMPEKAKEEAIDAINLALAGNKLVHRVAEILPLGDIARSHELIESGNVRGCVVLDVSG